MVASRPSRFGTPSDMPVLYGSEKTSSLTDKVICRTYTLMTGDSFDVGGAYSLHVDETSARNYKPANYWQPALGSKLEEVFVSKRTYKQLLKSRDKVIFRSWEK